MQSALQVATRPCSDIVRGHGSLQVTQLSLQSPVDIYE